MTTKTLRVGLMIPALAATVIASACVAWGRQGAAERAGQALDGAGRKVRSGVVNTFSRTKTSVHNQEIISRVYSRIHWDKTLVGSTLELEVQDGTAVLRGAVIDAAARERAVLLARDTVGIALVVDELTVLPPPREIPADAVAPAFPVEKPARAIVAP